MIYHYRKLIAEHSRIRAFQNGITAAVRPGDLVCEIGTGLGTYAFMASRAGAAKVYAIEEGPVIELARKLYMENRNGLGEIEFINQYSTQVHLPQSVDVVIYEDFECQGITPIHETIIEDACLRILKPGGTFIPYGMELFWAPVQAEKIWSTEVSCLDQSKEEVLGLDYSMTRNLVSNERIVTALEADAVLCPPVLLESINFIEKQQLAFTRTLEMTVTTSGTLHGFGSWADFLFPGGHCFSLSYEKPVTAYSRAFFPLPEPVFVEPGDGIHMNVSVMKKPLHMHTWSWWGEIDNRQGQRKYQWQSSTFNVAQFQPQDVYLPRSLDSDFHPILNQEGYWRKFILQQMDGSRTIEDIADDLMAQYPEDFSSLAEALTKITRIAKKCAI